MLVLVPRLQLAEACQQFVVADGGINALLRIPDRIAGGGRFRATCRGVELLAGEVLAVLLHAVPIPQPARIAQPVQPNKKDEVRNRSRPNQPTT